MSAKPEQCAPEDDLAETFGRVIEAALADRNVSFRKLAEAAGLNPASDFVGASLVDVDLRDELQRLDIRGTQVSDVSQLAGLSGLQELHLARTQISNVSPLA